ncbi:hypothetical protein CkaCkLH20_11328 [Colletotrichum karsti]|uniref:Spt20-like SEP domain-containing protein n=1 Tax=Colletotrichum karsti TaxID=1095194 RepID=A0A9P6HVE7_9PEZI|nr:uncharacterized protein CkaCkLH20_11328 [Colletotrichum karsti]KAF9871159.1 hypothetical protein CkaCkLH20_11328 [Colletotrichum karsti]
MAPVVTAIQPPAVASKIKRPVPPGIQTNGASSIRSSPSPSMSTKKPPNSATMNGANPQSARPANRTRREPSAHAGRNSRNSAGLRSASLAADLAAAQAVEPPPYIVTDEYILKKYAGHAPSLVVHFHPTHFRFDQQDGMFQYSSPMRIFLEHLRSRTVPHDLIEYFTQGGVSFYEGCLIVQVHDHKSVAQVKDVARPTSASSKVVPSSIHNHNPYIVPSPYVPYPKESLGTHPEPSLADQEDVKPKTAEQKDKESMPAPSLPGDGQKSKTPSKPKIFTVVLHPTPESLQADLLLKTMTPRGVTDGRGSIDGTVPPSTPISMVPPTPTAGSMPPPAKKPKRERMELDASNIYLAESQILLATNAPLFLEPTKNAEETIGLLDALAHPKHSDPPPQPKTRKRTVAEMEADEAAAADQEKYMLILDDRLASAVGGAQSGANGADKEGPAVVSTFEPRFERFKVIADIKREYEQKKEAEKAEAAANERKLQLQKQKQMQDQQAAIAAQRQAEEEKLRREQAMAQELKARHEQQQREQQRRVLAQQAAANQAQNNQHAAGNMPQAQQAPTPMPNGSTGAVASGIPAQTQARFTQVSQPTVSSPVVRQGTPHSMSSPMPGAVAMQQSNSNMANSPPRPPSAVQGHPPNVGGVPMSHSMSARASQQSHPAGTPRMPQGTPSMQATPVPRPAVAATPRMGQASPPPNMMATNSQMGQHMMNMGTPVSMPQQMQNPSMAAAQLAQQQRAIQQQQLQAAMQSGMGMMNGNMNGQQMTQQQQQFMQQQMHQRMVMQQHQQQQQQQQQQQHQQQHQQHNQQRGNMNQMMTQQLAAQYAQQLHRMGGSQMGGGQMSPQMQAQLQAQMAQMGNPMQRQMGGGGGQNMMNGGHGGMNMQQAMMQMQQQQAVNNSSALTAQVKMQGMALYNKQIASLAAKWGGNVENIPPEQMDTFKRDCMVQAKQQIQAVLAQRRAQQVMMQQQQAQQQQHQHQQMQGMGGMMGPHGM